MYSVAPGLEAASDFIHMLKEASSDEVKSRSASSARESQLAPVPFHALPNLPAFVQEAEEKVKSLLLGVESLAIAPYPSSIFQYATWEPTWEPGAGCPAFMSSIICAGVRG